MNKPFLILVAGGSASGKSTVVANMIRQAQLNEVLKINQDDYYLDQTTIPMEERLDVNYDHPDSIDNDLLYEHILKLLDGESIDKPVYDYVSYNRSESTQKIDSKPIIIIEGILTLVDPRLRELADLKIFVNTDDDIRLIRRILRDVKERGRSVDGIVSQYLKTVKPMYHKYVKPTIRYADIIIPNDQSNKVAVDVIVGKLKQIAGGIKWF